MEMRNDLVGLISTSVDGFCDDERLGKVLRRRHPQTKASKRRIEKLKKATFLKSHKLQKFGKKSMRRMQSLSKTAFKQLESLRNEQVSCDLFRFTTFPIP